jgi:predicted permease
MNWFGVFARRRPEVSADAGNADLTVAQQRSYKAQLEREPGGTSYAIAKPRSFLGPVLRDRGPNTGKDARVATWLGGVAGMVLLIACAIVANLLLARALRRRREIAVRIALGISRTRLAMQLITESVLLSAAGGLLGLMIAQWGGGVLRTALLGDVVEVSAFADPRLLAFAATLAIVTGLLTGLAPVFQAGRADVAASLKAGAREGTVHRSRLRAGLLVGQAALSVVLLVGAGLFLRSMQNVKNVRLGYDADRLAWVDLVDRGVKLDSNEQVAIREKMLIRVQQLPGVEHAARAMTIPFWSEWELDLFVAGIDSVRKLGEFSMQAGSADFFATITAEDRASAPKVIVVGEAMAKKLWPGQDAIGKCIRLHADTMPCTTVVGIAEDVHRGKLSEADLHYYLSADQYDPSQGGLFVRTTGPASTHVEQIRRELQKLMPGASYVTITPMSTILGGETKSWRLGATMFAVFGALALVLAAIGLYSVIAYNVTQRTHEMGVRVALGAQGGDVIGLIVREGLRVVVPGVALGAVIALLSGKWIAPLLFQVSPKDPPVIVSVIATLVVVAIAASWAPADPNEALRAD